MLNFVPSLMVRGRPTDRAAVVDPKGIISSFSGPQYASNAALAALGELYVVPSPYGRMRPRPSWPEGQVMIQWDMGYCSVIRIGAARDMPMNRPENTRCARMIFVIPRLARCSG